MRLYLRASAVAAPVLLFGAFLLFAHGERLWSVLPGIIAVLLLWTFPSSITETPAPSLLGKMDGPAWMRRIAVWGVYFRCFQIPEVKTLIDHMTKGQLLWDWRLIASVAVMTLSYVWTGWRSVSAITDKAIYTHYCRD